MYCIFFVRHFHVFDGIIIPFQLLIELCELLIRLAVFRAFFDSLEKVAFSLFPVLFGTINFSQQQVDFIRMFDVPFQCEEGTLLRFRIALMFKVDFCFEILVVGLVGAMLEYFVQTLQALI